MTTSDYHLGPLSLSSQPIIAKPFHNPIFGVTSFAGTNTTPSTPKDDMMDVVKDIDADAMDWEPLSVSVSSRHPPSKPSTQPAQEEWLIRPQVFFPPERPTGLEGLFERTRLEELPRGRKNDDLKWRRLGFGLSVAVTFFSLGIYWYLRRNFAGTLGHAQTSLTVNRILDV